MKDEERKKPKKVSIGFSPTQHRVGTMENLIATHHKLMSVVDGKGQNKIQVTQVSQSKFENAPSYRQILNLGNTPNNSKQIAYTKTLTIPIVQV